MKRRESEPAAPPSPNATESSPAPARTPLVGSRWQVAVSLSLLLAWILFLAVTALRG